MPMTAVSEVMDVAFDSSMKMADYEVGSCEWTVAKADVRRCGVGSRSSAVRQDPVCVGDSGQAVRDDQAVRHFFALLVAQHSTPVFRGVGEAKSECALGDGRCVLWTF